MFIHTSLSLRAKLFSKTLLLIDHILSIFFQEIQSQVLYAVFLSFVCKLKVDLYSNILYPYLPSLSPLIVHHLRITFDGTYCMCTDVTYSVKLLRSRVRLGLKCGLHERNVLRLMCGKLESIGAWILTASPDGDVKLAKCLRPQA